MRNALRLLIAFWPLVAAAADRPVTTGVIQWQSGPAYTSPQDAATIAAQVSATLRGTGRHVVVQFEQPLDDAQRTQVAQAGLHLLSYVGDNAYFAAVDSAATDAAAVARLATLRCVLPVAHAWKLHPTGLAGQWPAWAVAAAAQRADVAALAAACVLFHGDVDLEREGVPLVTRYGATVRSRLASINGLVVELPLASVAALADEDPVMWIEPPLPALQPCNDGNRALTGADLVQAAPYNLDGSGVTVLVYDGGTADPTHADLAGRVNVRDSSGLHYHSTHVAGTIGGSGAESGGLYRGMAPGVTIESYGFEMPGGENPYFLYADPGDTEHDYCEAISLYGADIANNSIGSNVAGNRHPCEWEGNYGVMDALLDTIVRGDGTSPLFPQPFRMVWGNGNERAWGTCGSLYHTTGPPACAKNHITVGAVDSDTDAPTTFTSFGPSDDDRLKPDIAAPGCQTNGDRGVTSCAIGSGYQTLCGTSMSSPTVCGLSALLLQDYRAHFPNRPDFRNSTLKAILAHTAADIGNVGPDYQSGYGSVRIEPAVQLVRDGNFTEGVVGQDSVYRATVVVTVGSGPLKVTLAWDDVPGVPNVTPVLVNDLDLQVYSPTNARLYPWTLGGLANPSAPAVRDRADHVNNIEQVYLATPAAGTYEIRVVGYNVPQGPQPFSLTATPTLHACSSLGTVLLEHDYYGCAAAATLRVVDCDLNTNPAVTDTVAVAVTSTSEPAGETVMLTETAPDSATFVGNVALSTTDAAGVVRVAHGDTLTLTYQDADNGAGVPATVTDTATLDCVAPTISNVQVTAVNTHDVTITFQTSEPTVPTVRYGQACNALNDAQHGLLRTSHTLLVTGLRPATDYVFAVEVADRAGNTAYDDAGGTCYAFTTPDVPQLLAEAFPFNFDLAYRRVLYEPDSSADGYSICTMPITALPTDPTGGTALNLAPYQYATLYLNGATVSLAGVSYGTIYVNECGHITFLAGDPDEYLDHYAQPRVSGLFCFLDAHTSGGSVSWKQLSDRVAVTWLDVPSAAGDFNTFQIELYFDGRIALNYAEINADYPLCGLSTGFGVPLEYRLTNLSYQPACGPLPPVADDVVAAMAANEPTTFALPVTDDGLPTGDLDTIILSQPTHGTLLDAGTGARITSVPYTLAAGGHVVRFVPHAQYIGNDSVQFKANDGGVPPDGGDSNTALASITVGGVRPLYVFTLDDDPGWPRDCQWEFGVPTGQGESVYSHADPTSGATGDNVFGVNLNGAYSLAPIGPCRLTAGPFNLRGVTNVELHFQRWLNTDRQPYTFATVELSLDGTAWTEVWNNGEDLLKRDVWQPEEVSLSPFADRRSRVYVCWTYTVTGLSMPYTGWNLDDIAIWGATPYVPPLLGDLNCDGTVSFADINPFVLYLSNLATWQATYPDCPAADGDINQDGFYPSFGDINAFVTLLSSGGS